MTLPPNLIAASGLLVGVAVGYTARRANLCTLGAIESALMGQDWRRMKVFGLALGLALVLTQGMVLAGLFDPSQSPYVPTRMALLSTLVGSVLFGLGMAQVGTCAFGSLLRLGGGDLRSLVTVILFAAVATMTLRGSLSTLRIGGFEAFAIDMPGSSASSLPDVLSYLSGQPLRLPLTLIMATVLAAPALLDARLRPARRLMRAGVVLGLGIATGWLLTGVLADPFEARQRVQSLTFVSPVARGFAALVLGARDWLDFGVMSVPGVVLGATIAARKADELRWEAFDDHIEMRRHIVGAALMGFGGVLAGGCTIGQGLTAGSLLSLSWPVAVIGIMLGARLGLAVLLTGSWAEWLHSLRMRND